MTVREPVRLPDSQVLVDGVALPGPAAHDLRGVTVEQAVGEPGTISVLYPAGQHFGPRDDDSRACTHGV